MNTILILLLGLFTGWAIAVLADFMPRFAVEPPQRRGGFSPLPIAAFTAALFMLFWLTAPADFIWLAGGSAYLLLIALIDLKYRLVLNVMLYPVVLLLPLLPDLKVALVGGVFAFSVFFAASLVGDLGGGDVKLAGVLGLTFGFPNIIGVLVIGGTAGAVIASGLLITHRAKAMPYAPFLCLGALALLLLRGTL